MCGGGGGAGGWWVGGMPPTKILRLPALRGTFWSLLRLFRLPWCTLEEIKPQKEVKTRMV